MALDVEFKGKLTYDDDESLAAALEQLEEAVAEEDEELAELFEEEWSSFFGVKGAKLVVDISLSGPAEWWLAIEALVEGLTVDAVDGHVDGVLEGTPGKTRYFAGGEQDELDA